MKKREELEDLYKKHLKREREIIDHINAKSHEMEKKHIEELEEERRFCVKERQKLKKKMAVLDDVINTLSKRDKSSLEILTELLKEQKEEGE